MSELQMGLHHVAELLKKEGYRGASEIVTDADKRIKELEDKWHKCFRANAESVREEERLKQTIKQVGDSLCGDGDCFCCDQIQALLKGDSNE